MTEPLPAISTRFSLIFIFFDILWYLFSLPRASLHLFYSALIFEAVPNNNFTSHTKTAFTYTLGAGVQKLLNDHWQIGVGYEFADWGKSELGRAPGQTLNSGLKLSHLYTNGVLFNLTYLA